MIHFDKITPGKAIAGSMLILLGIVLLLANFGMLPDDMWKYWPLILVFIGASVVFSQQVRFDSKKKK